MIRFYGRLLLAAPKAAWNALGHFGNFALLALAVLFVVNRPLAKSVSAWEGISPFWAIGPFALFLVIGLLAANYNAFKATTAHDPGEGPELEIEELIDSSIDTSTLGEYSKIKIAKASNCEFKTDLNQESEGDSSSSSSS